MFKKTGLGQQLEIIPGPPPGAKQAGQQPSVRTCSLCGQTSCEHLRAGQAASSTQPGAGRGR